MSGEMLVAIELEAGPMPDVGNRLGVDVAHAGVGGDVVAENHHVAAAVNVEPLEDEGARDLVGVEVRRPGPPTWSDRAWC